MPVAIAVFLMGWFTAQSVYLLVCSDEEFKYNTQCWFFTRLYTHNMHTSFSLTCIRDNHAMRYSHHMLKIYSSLVRDRGRESKMKRKCVSIHCFLLFFFGWGGGWGGAAVGHFSPVGQVYLNEVS